MSDSGYFNSPWPGEDGGARRLQIPSNFSGLNIGTNDKLHVIRRRLWWDFGNMIVLGEKGKVYLMRANYLQKRYLGLPSSSIV